ncbi:MAG: hypothetical protein CMJ78_27185 [Planctomycetaceae bacterium]|nr:hypothetical protein [Planctomycetaceae bacterium]
MSEVNKRRLLLFRTVAVLLGLAPFVLLELILAAMDRGMPQDFVDPFVGFSKVHPLFEVNEDAEVYRTAKSREINFGRQSFLAKKPDNGFRAFVLGGSTVRGRPFQTDTAFAKWAELELSLRDPDTHFEFVNCGGLSYASYRLSPILDEVLSYDPDLIVLATGHNEYLENRTYGHIKDRSAAQRWVEDHVYSLRTITLARSFLHGGEAKEKTALPEDVDPLLDSESGYESYRRDDQWRSRVAQHFRYSLASMIDRCREHNVPVLLVKLGTNLRDCPPFKSELNESLDADAQTEFLSEFESARKSEAESTSAALSLYRKCELIDAEHALLNYRIARCLDRLGKQKEAHSYYVKARESDICPLRMTTPLADVLDQLHTELKVPMIDVPTLLDHAAVGNIAGQESYVDHVHPGIAVHQAVGIELAAALKRERFHEDGSSPSIDKRRGECWKHLKSLGPNYLPNGNRRVAWLEHWARRTKLFEDTLPRDTQGYLRLGHKWLGFGQFEQAWGSYKMAIREDPASVDAVIAHSHQLYEVGQWDLARELLGWIGDLQLSKKQSAEVIAAKVVLLFSLGEVDSAQELFQATQASTLDQKSFWHKDFQAIASKLQ